ncbi:MAG: hypothetical protein QHI48_00565 [Bacteroidota bacterium]|nr:hypothetical protein [Bacteroidota bacterium]
MKSIAPLARVILLMVAAWATSYAQSIEDALRIALPPQTINARSSGMGNAFIGVADDFSALFWNPAGLGLLRESEFSVGLTNLSVTNDASFLGSKTSFDDGTTHINHIGLALPFPVSRGSFVLAAGYNRLTNFLGVLRTEGFNPYSSIQRSLYNMNEDYDLAWKLGLEDTLVLTLQETGQPGWLAIPINRNVYQVQEVFESGNLGQWSFGGSIEFAPNFLAGLALNILTGSYRYDRTFIETDPNGFHQNTIVGDGGAPGRVAERTDFKSLELRQTVAQDISGYSLKFGMMYSLGSYARLGLSIQSPNSVTISEDYSNSGESRFANSISSYSAPTVKSEYDVTTGWVFGFGVSASPLAWLRFSGDLELADPSRIEISNTNVIGLTNLNSDIKRKLRSTNNFRVGAEVRVPTTDLFLRGGYGISFSPWKEDPSSFDAKTISAGAGYLFDERVMLNAAFCLTSYSSFRLIYPDPDTENVPDSLLRIDEKIHRTAVVVSLGYRF